MVDFNNETTITQNAGIINRIQVLERRFYLQEAINQYYKLIFQNASCQDNIIKAGLLTLFLEIRETLKRKLKPEDFNTLSINILKGSDDFKRDFIIINEVLDKVGLIKLDNKKDYNRSLVEEENKHFGL